MNNYLEKAINVYLVFLDISIAVEKVYHHGLIFNMEQFKTSENILDLRESSLTERKQYIIINSK